MYFFTIIQISMDFYTMRIEFIWIYVNNAYYLVKSYYHIIYNVS